MDIVMTPIKLNLKPFILLSLLGLFLVGCGGAPGNTPGLTPGVDDTDSSFLKIGTGGGSSFSEGVASGELITANSSSASWVVGVVIVGNGNIAVVDEYTVNFTSTCVATGLSTLSRDSAATVAGRVSVSYTSDGCSGIDTVVATVNTGSNVISAVVDLNITQATGNSGGGDEGTVVRMGSGTGAAFQEDVLLAGSTSLPAGGDTSITVSLVDIDGVPYTAVTPVVFSSGCVSSGLSEFAPEEVSTSGGVASAQYRTNGCTGTDIVTATATVDGIDLSASVSLSIESDNVLGIEFVEVVEPLLSLPGAGGAETTEVFFRLLGGLGAPVVGEAVSFRLSSSIGGISIAPNRESDISDFDGIVSTTVQSGTVSTTFQVVATHDATGNSTNSDGIVVSSGVPVDSKFSLSLSTFTPRDAFDTDGIEVDLSIIASDYFGNDVPDGAQVYFASPESGNVDQSCILISGECSVVWRSAGSRPDDFRASIIAYIDGAEDYTDTNGNTVYDAGDVRGIDLGEPFINEDELGGYDIGEFFVDSNRNGIRDVANGEWDGPCLDAVDASADCSGNDSVSISKVAVIRMPTDTPRMIEATIDYSDGVGARDLFEGALIDLELSPDLSVLITFTIADNNTLADIFGGHPMPSGTNFIIDRVYPSGVVFDDGAIAGDTEVEVSNSATGPTTFSVVIYAEDDGDFSTGSFLQVGVHEGGAATEKLGEFVYRLRM